jgi:hypothetical protein
LLCQEHFLIKQLKTTNMATKQTVINESNPNQEESLVFHYVTREQLKAIRKARTIKVSDTNTVELTKNPFFELSTEGEVMIEEIKRDGTIVLTKDHRIGIKVSEMYHMRFFCPANKCVFRKKRQRYGKVTNSTDRFFSVKNIPSTKWETIEAFDGVKWVAI